MRWWIFYFCFSDIHTVTSSCVCTTWITKPRNRGWQGSQEKQHLQPVQELWIKHMAPPWLPACVILYGVQKKQGCETTCLPPDHSFWDMQVMGDTQVTSYFPFSRVFLHIFSVSGFPHQLFMLSYNVLSSKAAMQSGKSVTMSWLIKYFRIYLCTMHSTYFHFLINYSIITFIHCIKLQKLC